MAPTYIANFVALAAMLLTILGVNIAPADLQVTVTTILAVAVPLFTMLRQLLTGRSTLMGTRPTE
jgi:uncharacterized membrane protein YGL010W